MGSLACGWNTFERLAVIDAIGQSLRNIASSGQVSFGDALSLAGPLNLVLSDTRSVKTDVSAGSFSGSVWNAPPTTVITPGSYDESLSSADGDALDLGFYDQENFHSYNYRGTTIDTLFSPILSPGPNNNQLTWDDPADANLGGGPNLLVQEPSDSQAGENDTFDPAVVNQENILHAYREVFGNDPVLEAWVDAEKLKMVVAPTSALGTPRPSLSMVWQDYYPDLGKGIRLSFQSATRIGQEWFYVFVDTGHYFSSGGQLKPKDCWSNLFQAAGSGMPVSEIASGAAFNVVTLGIPAQLDWCHEYMYGNLTDEEFESGFSDRMLNSGLIIGGLYSSFMNPSTLTLQLPRSLVVKWTPLFGQIWGGVKIVPFCIGLS